MKIPPQLNPPRTTLKHLGHAFDLSACSDGFRAGDPFGIVEITPGSPSDHVSVVIPAGGTQTFVRLKVSQ